MEEGADKEEGEDTEDLLHDWAALPACQASQLLV
jgi:hypothetical protein